MPKIPHKLTLVPALLMVLLLASWTAMWLMYMELGEFKRVYLSVRPGMSEREVQTALGGPDVQLDRMHTDLDEFYDRIAYVPVPSVDHWQTAVGYYHAWYIHMVFLDSRGTVMCVVTSKT